MLLIGLGNPGNQYKNTRHNVGWLFLDYVYEKSKVVSPWAEKSNFEYAVVKSKGQTIKLFKPMTFMNLSGMALKEILKKFPNEDYYIIYDDVSIDFGGFKYKEVGGHGSHNGIKSIIEVLGNKNFKRIKIGINQEEKNILSDFVLSDFSKNELESLVYIFNDVNKKIEMNVRGFGGKKR